MTDFSLPFFSALHSGARAIAMHAVAALPPADSSRLADSAFRIDVDVSESPPEATITIASDAEPIFRVPAAVWPRGFGQAVAAFVQATLARLSGAERRRAMALIPQAQTVVVLQPADQGEFRVELRAAGAVAVLGRIGVDAGGVRH